jgi:hypothetical protein
MFLSTWTFNNGIRVELCWIRQTSPIMTIESSAVDSHWPTPGIIP